MAPQLLRSLLGVMRSERPRTDAAVPGSAPPAVGEYLIVVARREPALYAHLRNRHSGDARVRVIVDRRGADDDDPTSGPPAEDRRRRRSWLAVGASHEVVALAGSASEQVTVEDEEVPTQMNEMMAFEDPQRVTQWLAEGQHVLGQVIPALLDDRDRLRHALEAKERECDRLVGELAELRRHMGALQSEVEGLRGERVAVADAFGGVVDLLGQLQRPLGEIARRLQEARTVAVDTSAA